MRITPRRPFCVVALAGLMMVSSGCATDRGGTGSARTVVPARPTGLLIEPEPARQLGYNVAWATDLKVPRNENILSAAVLGDVLVVVEVPGNIVSAVSMENGRGLWRRPVGTRTDRLFPAARHGDNILVNTATRLYELRARDGEAQGAAELETLASTGPTVVEGMALIGALNGNVIGHDIEAGYAKWRYDLAGQIVVPPVESGDNIVAADTRGVYAMLDAVDGTAMWRGRTFGPVTAKPGVDRGTVYIASGDGTLYAVNRSTGRDVWKAPMAQPLTESPVSFDTVVLLPLPGRGVVAFEPADGAERWRLDTPARPILRLDERAVLATPNSLMLVDLETGRVAADARTLPLQTVLAGPDNSLVLVSPKGRVLRLNRMQ